MGAAWAMEATARAAATELVKNMVVLEKIEKGG